MRRVQKNDTAAIAIGRDRRRRIPFKVCVSALARAWVADMNFLAIVIALALEQWKSFAWRNDVQRTFVRYARALARRFNAGAKQQGALTALFALAPPVVLVSAGYAALSEVHPMLALAWNVAILYVLVGFRHF